MKIKSFGLSETKLFHLHRIFKNWGAGGWGSGEPPLDPPLHSSVQKKRINQFLTSFEVT